MKINWKKHDGTTLVELMIAIAIGSMILLATSSVLLLGLRIHHKTTETVTQQYTARTVITMLENLATEGDVSKVGNAQDGSWKLYDRSYNVILSYSKELQTIYTGDHENPMLENVSASSVVLENNLLTVELEHDESKYQSSIFCRTVPADAKNEEEQVPSDNTDRYAEQKKNFVNHLLKQEGAMG